MVVSCPLRPPSPPRPPFGSRQKSCEHFAQSTLKRSSKTRFLRWKHHSLVPTTHLSPSLPAGSCIPDRSLHRVWRESYICRPQRLTRRFCESKPADLLSVEASKKP